MRGRFAIAVAVCAVTLARTAPAHASTVSSTSCVDLDNDGACNPGDPALAPILDATGGVFDTSVAAPGYTPPRCCVGVILDNLTTTLDTLSIHATGRIHIIGTIKAKEVESVDLETPQDVYVAPQASLTVGRGKCCLSDFTIVADELFFGARSRITAGGEDSFWDVEARNIDLGDDTSFAAKGSGASIFMQANNKLAFGLHNSFKTPRDGGLSLYSYQSIAATELHITAGDIDIESIPPEDNRLESRQLTITDGVINQNSVDGSLTLLAGSGDKAADAIILTHTLMTTKSDFIDIEPDPVIVP